MLQITVVVLICLNDRHGSEGWLLTVVVEHETGPRNPKRGVRVDKDEQIELHIFYFYDEFIRPGREIANVVAEVEDDTADVDLNKLLSSIEESRHGLGRGRSRD